MQGYYTYLNVSNIVVGVENDTNFECAATLVTDRLRVVSQIGGGNFYRRKSVNCHVGMYVHKAAHLKLISQPTTMLETFIIRNETVTELDVVIQFSFIYLMTTLLSALKIDNLKFFLNFEYKYRFVNCIKFIQNLKVR
jgi:hypothetical protein